ncbi:HNH endonuclease signature motif containing protein [Mycobacterium sp. 1274761.0]|uniref:HNH endonuclease signature motif containing protein n=1 Tax=Mycobacterium sp. 1274761.0 TaxID=1834077 RepID=UPI0007FEF8F2|nr:HNH endonuclease signature motif containing protein [Mycobacterium sp. 1274761.0]OBK74545.1 hypothetical protein A5651_10710 [Mycobacterium sp. 1274761.0]
MFDVEGAVTVRPCDRLEVLFEELSQLCGQRNAIDGRIVEIVAEIDRDGLWSITGTRSVAALVAWKLGASTANATTIATLAQRCEEFPQCVAGLREGRLSLDQVGVIAARAGAGSDEHYAQLASVATVNQLRTALKLESPPAPPPATPHDTTDDDDDEDADEAPEPVVEAARSISTTSDEVSTTWRITLPHPEAATFDAALGSHLDALITEWNHDHDTGASTNAPPRPSTVDALLRLIETGWDAEVVRRPHAHRTTVVVHLDVNDRIGALHRGPLLSDADRRYLSCDATCEVWFQRNGQPIGAGRSTRVINRRLRRALEYRYPTCAVPGCGATRGLHAHHIRHWEDGGATELDNLVLLCPYHHRLHHRGGITITGPADHLVVTDATGAVMTNSTLARPPTTPPPEVPPYAGPLGERADWWWYDPYQPPPPPPN